MKSLFLALSLFALFALLKNFRSAIEEQASVVFIWLATIGIISAFATFLSIIYMFVFKLISRKRPRPEINFLQVLKDRELSCSRNSMMPLLTSPKSVSIPLCVPLSTPIDNTSPTPIGISPGGELRRVDENNDSQVEILIC